MIFGQFSWLTLGLALVYRALTLENLLRCAASDATQTSVLQQALQSVDVICLGAYTTDHMQRPWTQINGCHHAEGLVLPCFLSEQALHAAGFEHEPCLLVAFSEFVRAAQGYDVPIIIDLVSPHAYTIPPEAFHRFCEPASIAALPGSSWH